MKVKICHISDTHNKHKHIEIPECDIAIHSGDLTSIGEPREFEDFFRWFNRQTQATYRVAIPGNHDRKTDPKFWINGDEDIKVGEAVRKNWNKNTYFMWHNTINLMGVNIWGSPVTPWFHGDRWAHNKHRGEEIDKIWCEIPEETDVLVTHGPPRYKLDKLYFKPCDPDNLDTPDGHVGCEDLARHIKERVKPPIHLFGHIHETYGHIFDGVTNYFNGSICNLSYEPVNKPWLMEFDTETKEVNILMD